ncbi:UNVERIFIED_CONTAM: hypothetical protein ABID98_000578 [Brevibacillus sp. OAP136]
MSESFRPVFSPDPTLASPSSLTMGEVLEPSAFSDLYHHVRDEGLPYFARVNSEGDVELFLVFESIDAFSDATRDAVSVEFKAYKGALLAVIWTLADPQEPLGFPLKLDIKKDDERYMALRMIEQPELAIHYLSFADGEITHIFSETCNFSGAEQAHVLELIRYLYDDEPKEHEMQPTSVDEVKEEGLISIAAGDLAEDVFEQAGTAYLFDYAKWVREEGEEDAQARLMHTVQQAVLVMRRHSRSEVRESAFTIWAGEQQGVLWLFVTPMLYPLFEVVHTKDDETNPFARFLYALPTYVETVDASPLACGAYPILRYERGKLYHLELDDSFTDRLSAIAKRHGIEGEPYLHT